MRVASGRIASRFGVCLVLGTLYFLDGSASGQFGGLSPFSDGLSAFSADLGKKEILGKTIRVPYVDVVSYFGYIQPGGKPDEVKDGKNMYYLYLWVPVVAPEIGVRMVSPVKGTNLTPGSNDFKDAKFDDNAGSDVFFDTWVRLERCVLAVTPEDIGKPCSQWAIYGDNDDSSELPAQPSGNKYNSVLRLTSEPSNPLKALVRGMYRIGFTSYKRGDVQGTFVAQVGAPVKLPGTAIARTPADLAKAVNKP
jgi:hypothetical protein